MRRAFNRKDARGVTRLALVSGIVLVVIVFGVVVLLLFPAM